MDKMIYKSQNVFKESLPFEFYSVDSTFCSIGCRLNWHRLMEFHVVVKGKIRYMVDGTTFWAEQGTIVLMNPNQVHGDISFGENNQHFYIKFDLNMFCTGIHDVLYEKYIKYILDGHWVFPNVIHDIKLFETFMKIKEMELSKPLGWELLVKSKLLTILQILISQYLTNSDKKNILDTKDVKNAKLLIEFISNNYNSNISLAHLANMMNMSCANISRIFKQTTGYSVIEYINILRCNNAKILIKNGVSVTEAAYAVGFGDSNYFSRIFKKIYGYSPKKQKEST